MGALSEPLRVTLFRTGTIALVLGALLVHWSGGGLSRWPIATALMLWPSFGGHWVELMVPQLAASAPLQCACRAGCCQGGSVVRWRRRPSSGRGSDRDDVDRAPAIAMACLVARRTRLHRNRAGRSPRSATTRAPASTTGWVRAQATRRGHAIGARERSGSPSSLTVPRSEPARPSRANRESTETSTTGTPGTSSRNNAAFSSADGSGRRVATF